MALPFSMPPYVANPKEAWKHRIEIECYNLGTECLGAVLIDNSVWLEGCEASNSFFLIPRNPTAKIAYSTASFYADCIGFEHDFSALAIPSTESYLGNADIPWPCWFKALREPTPAEDFVGSLREGAEVANRLWNGFGPTIVFRYDWIDHQTTEVDGYDVVKVDWTARYFSVRQAIHLYCAALRQIDPLTAYLCFYRVIENCSRTNGKDWIQSIIESDLTTSSIAWYECPPDAIVPEYVKNTVRLEYLTKIHQNQKWTNLFEVVRAIAVHRRNELIQNSTPTEIAKRLYNDNRCGIAHGNEIRTHDFANDFLEVLRDLKLLRLLARIAIEQKMDKVSP